MANIQIVETSLRDGNQCLWGALGVTTANTLTIAPVMERAGYRAIDFTTSTHMGVAVRYKQEDPWERIRAMADICRDHAAAVPLDRLPLHRLGDRQPRVHGAGVPHARHATASAASRWPTR